MKKIIKTRPIYNNVQQINYLTKTIKKETLNQNDYNINK